MNRCEHVSCISSKLTHSMKLLCPHMHCLLWPMLRAWQASPQGAKGKGAQGKGAQGKEQRAKGQRSKGTKGKGVKGKAAQGKGAKGRGAKALAASGPSRCYACEALVEVSAVRAPNLCPHLSLASNDMTLVVAFLKMILSIPKSEYIIGQTDVVEDMRTVAYFGAEPSNGTGIMCTQDCLLMARCASRFLIHNLSSFAHTHLQEEPALPQFDPKRQCCVHSK